MQILQLAKEKRSESCVKGGEKVGAFARIHPLMVS